jgi:hypothetical protein
MTKTILNQLKQVEWSDKNEVNEKVEFGSWILAVLPARCVLLGIFRPSTDQLSRGIPSTA